MNITFENLDPKLAKEFHKDYKDLVFTFFYPEYTKKTLSHFCESDKEFNPKTIKEYAERGNIFVAKDGNRFVGALITDDPDGGVVFVRWLAVNENYQGQGIATKLLNLFEKSAKQKGAHCIMLCTEERNLEFYKKRNYQYMGLNPVGYFGAVDYWHYKQLQEAKEKNYLN